MSMHAMCVAPCLRHSKLLPCAPVGPGAEGGEVLLHRLRLLAGRCVPAARAGAWARDQVALRPEASIPSGSPYLQHFATAAQTTAGIASDRHSQMTLRRQEPLKRPAAKAVAKAKAKAAPAPGLTSKRCVTILQRVQKAASMPKEVLLQLRQALKCAKSGKKGDLPKATALLGGVMAKAVRAFEEELATARESLEKAKEEHQTLESQQADAEAQLKSAKKAIVDFKVKLKDSQRFISEETKALTNASAERKSALQDVKLAEKDCCHLQQVQEKSYKPLREAEVSAPTAPSRKQINSLCKAAKKVGFHRELLSVAPAVLKKELTKRQTFDQLVLRALDAEFSKRSQALQSKLEENQQSLEQQDQAMEEKRQALAAAKDSVKHTARMIVEAEAQAESSKRSVQLAVKQAKRVPQMVKQQARKFEAVRSKYNKFRAGPLATYLTYRPGKHVKHDSDEEATQRA
ncbi:unnamed protein product [Effrenium voratum]|nr:unnamed protein product [Effrenium voratum]